MKPRALCAFAIAALLAPAAGGRAVDPRDHKLVVLGIDGMDPKLLRGFMDEGIVPNLKALAESGGFQPLATSVPPQSPVAWSNFITGMDPGHHGIFDFIALDRKTMLPYLSIARVEKSDREPLAIGRWRIPLGSDRTLQLRKGRAFWEILEEQGVPATLFRMPANYPPIASGRALSGMGTPDLRGTSGTFSYYTDDPGFEPGSVSGGMIHRVALENQTVEASIEGPPNGFLDGAPATQAPFTVHVDPEHPVAEIRIGSERVLLNAGEWSGWLPVSFELVPGLMDVGGIVRFYLKETRPHFRLYVSPVNIDPADPAQLIANPEEYARELFEASGPFYTQEMPEDTKALTHHVLTPSEFLQQSELVLDERRRLLSHELARFQSEQRRGLLFFYFSSIDQRSHMLWRQMDLQHPYHDPDAEQGVREALRTSYVEIDEIVGTVMQTLDDDTTLIVMSDHGFSPFRYQANLNSWLEQNGYLALKNPKKRDSYEWLQGIDWTRTRAFSIGLNSLYLSVQGRERYGIVPQGKRAELAREIADKLHQWVDPGTGLHVVTQAALREEVYHGPHTEHAPDILVGYGSGYRSSWATTTGKIPKGLIEANDREWSGDHCMDSRVVPGVLLSNRKLAGRDSGLQDLTVSILDVFGMSRPEGMPGESVFF